MVASRGRAGIHLTACLLFAAASLGGCVAAQPDLSHHPVTLRPPYESLPPAPPGATVPRGSPVVLTPLQQEAVVRGVMPFMKDGSSVRFGNLGATRNGNGIVTVCGEVDGRNAAGRQMGFAPFIGVLPAPAPATAGAVRRRDAVVEFVLVEIGSTPRDRAVVEDLCRESGIS